MRPDNEIRKELGLPIPTSEQLERRRKQALAALRPGHAVGPDNRLRPIPGAVTSYDPETGKPLVAVPLKTREPISLKKLRPVSIDALADVDGDVNEAESSIVELGQHAEPTLVVAGEDYEDDDLETAAAEQAADAALACADGLNDEDENAE